MKFEPSIWAAARLSVAPMMDGGDLVAISNACAASCAANVHASIARLGATSRFRRSVDREAANISLQNASAGMSAKCGAFVGISGLRQDPSFWPGWRGSTHGGLHLP